MKLKYFSELSSTHTRLKAFIKQNEHEYPICFVTKNQTNGRGSKDNAWVGKKGNLFFSFVINKSTLPSDLPLQSMSIYFSFLLKEIIKNLGSNIWFKWPNDFYIKNKKIGGTITSCEKNLVYCGIGINLIEPDKEFGCLDISLNEKELFENYFDILDKCLSWKQIFSKFEINFYNDKSKIQNKLLNNAILQRDGSLLVDDKKVYSLR